MNAQERKLIIGYTARPSLYRVSRPEIRSMTDLKGKIIGLGAIGGITLTITQRMLAHYGLAVGDFTVVSAGARQSVCAGG